MWLFEMDDIINMEVTLACIEHHFEFWEIIESILVWNHARKIRV